MFNGIKKALAKICKCFIFKGFNLVTPERLELSTH